MRGFQARAFQELKTRLANAVSLGYFDVTALTEVIADASLSVCQSVWSRRSSCPNKWRYLACYQLCKSYTVCCKVEVQPNRARRSRPASGFVSICFAACSSLSRITCHSVYSPEGGGGGREGER